MILCLERQKTAVRDTHLSDVYHISQQQGIMVGAQAESDSVNSLPSPNLSEKKQLKNGFRIFSIFDGKQINISAEESNEIDNVNEYYKEDYICNRNKTKLLKRDHHDAGNICITALDDSQLNKRNNMREKRNLKKKSVRMYCRKRKPGEHSELCGKQKNKHMYRSWTDFYSYDGENFENFNDPYANENDFLLLLLEEDDTGCYEDCGIIVIEEDVDGCNYDTDEGCEGHDEDKEIEDKDKEKEDDDDKDKGGKEDDDDDESSDKDKGGKEDDDDDESSDNEEEDDDKDSVSESEEDDSEGFDIDSEEDNKDKEDSDSEEDRKDKEDSDSEEDRKDKEDSDSEEDRDSEDDEDDGNCKSKGDKSEEEFDKDDDEEDPAGDCDDDEEDYDEKYGEEDKSKEGKRTTGAGTSNPGQSYYNTSQIPGGLGKYFVYVNCTSCKIKSQLVVLGSKTNGTTTSDQTLNTK
ncbi:hypothetical protein TNCV_50761 [Trichonephila clavipes]|nr:hypothetical protein TNCV_50761 [Trichonephila clavipes]